MISLKSCSLNRQVKLKHYHESKTQNNDILVFVNHLSSNILCSSFSYFETFDMLSASSFKEHLNWNEQFAQCNAEEDLSEQIVHSNLNVP